MAQIRKRAPLQYQAQVRLQGHPEASRTFTSKADAVAWATPVEQITKQGLVSLMRCLQIRDSPLISHRNAQML